MKTLLNIVTEETLVLVIVKNKKNLKKLDLLFLNIRFFSWSKYPNFRNNSEIRRKNGMAINSCWDVISFKLFRKINDSWSMLNEFKKPYNNITHVNTVGRFRLNRLRKIMRKIKIK
jgi:hypothetical protein